MTELPIRAVGIAWYKREDYARLRKLFKDGNKLPLTFDQWLKRAEKTQKFYESQGNIVVKAYIDPQTFPAWCASRGLDIDAGARMEWGNLIAFEQHGKTH